jgi:chromosome segregation ATPase
MGSSDGSRISQLEAELRDISTELANSIKREMDLEDIVEQLQTEGPAANREPDRTSDYFSDSGTSSIRPSTSEGNTKEDIQRIKRESEQLRAQLKADMTRKWQNERSSRQALESHIQLLEQKLSLSRRDNNESADITARVRELEVALEDARRRLGEERQTKENFEDLLTALRVDLEQHRNERDNLRDEVVPQLRAQIEGLETSFSESQKSDYEFTRLQQELQSLRDENAALQSARAMNMQFQSIAEEGEIVQSPTTSMAPTRMGGLQRSNTVLNRSNSRATLNRSNSLSRSNSTVNRGGVPENQQPLAEQLKDVTEQRNALHTTVKYLLRRQEAQRRQFEKRLKLTEAERDRATSSHTMKAGGYEREVRTLRSEINLLRKRADDALEQKWQCEKGLSGLKMDLDRSKQETTSLQRLLQARDETAPEILSSTLEQALKQLEQQREQARHQESLGSLHSEQELSMELEMSAQRSESLAAQVKKQIKANADLRNRLTTAVQRGERNQEASAEQINELQTKLKKLEEIITVAQMQSETAVMKHEEDVRVLRASHNIQLMRTKSGRKTPGYLTPTMPHSPMSPMFVNSRKSPRLDQTTSGPGIALQQALKTEYLENKVAELEKALAEAEKEMGEVVGRMNTAQMGVADLESER